LTIFIYSDPVLFEQWGLFSLICELFSKKLFTMGDDEFFDESNESKNQLKLSEIIKMSTCMKVLTNFKNFLYILLKLLY